MRWILCAMLMLGTTGLLVACSPEGAAVMQPVDRTGFYEAVDAKPLAEQALEWAYAGHITEMKKILDKDADLVNAVVGDWTPLLAAVENESGDMVDFLLEEGADPNLATAMGTPLEAAIQSDADRSIINALKSHGAK